ncbi:hypothetical protein SEA_RETRO23_47 [Mycobacterium phage Retro23]|uniref:Uncharacterized protein n=1 Tax=Mycobacterium phage Anselm TaxID=2041517 RepID=A0A2D1G5C7_9CAUD|nr:hypothetical protein KIY79_gp47 [Mycobacterium phage Anselm]ATN87046.1 hypothetical protein SEA_ANSELM_47 [Mycobacterium phage Anselm]ATN88400.1 hypothetical protein SEA_DALMATIAN_47 [Mycobacterium phage Dalmatian]QGJ89185.1 hypothetical protein SEA_RETRO23_47 [Mycobacterium phage Retro23]
MKLIEAYEKFPEPLSVTAAMYGTLVASNEAAEKYGARENYPEALLEYMDRCLEVAEEFITALGLEG